MSIAALNIISEAMDSLNLPYNFGEWTDKPVYPYFVGEYQEVAAMQEDGMQETSFVIVGFSRGTWLELEEAKEKISSYFPAVAGKVVIADNGSAVAVFYTNSLVIPTGDAELKRIEINLTIKEWSVIK